MRSSVGGQWSGYSNTASIRNGLRPPSVGADQASQGGIQVGWHNFSPTANTMRLERAVKPAAGMSPGWTVIPGVDFNTVSYLDPVAPETCSAEQGPDYRPFPPPGQLRP